MDHLIEQGLIDEDQHARHIANQLILVAPGTPEQEQLDTLTLEAITERLGKDGLIAMGDPDHVPVGLYGKAALEQLGLWPQLRRRIARADNARAALALVARGEVPLGIIYSTDLLLVDTIKPLYTFPALDNPIRYALALTTHGAKNPDARAFFGFLISDTGLALFEKYGFSVIRD